jgi:large subunit ribosomal protein L15
MQLHQIKPIHKKKKQKRIGRGGKRGTYSGRGIKGQKARAGRKLKPVIRELIKRYPKLRGYKFTPIKSKPVVVNVGILNKKFKEGEIVSPQILLEKKIIRKIKGKIPKVKILGKGNIKKPLIIKDCLFSKSAKEKIEKAGGKISY